jgi:hypothetical protein
MVIIKNFITLSDPITKKQFNKSNITLEVIETVDYGKVIGYVVKEKKDIQYMLMVKKGNLNFSPRLYYLDVEGNFKDNPNLLTLLDEKGKDLAEHIEATLETDNNKLKTIIWHKKSSSFVFDNHIIAEYSSKKTDIPTNLCLIDWNRNKKGYIKVWYGQKIKSSEFKII